MSSALWVGSLEYAWSQLSVLPRSGVPYTDGSPLADWTESIRPATRLATCAMYSDFWDATLFAAAAAFCWFWYSAAEPASAFWAASDVTTPISVSWSEAWAARVPVVLARERSAASAD